MSKRKKRNRSSWLHQPGDDPGIDWMLRAVLVLVEAAWTALVLIVAVPLKCVCWAVVSLFRKTK